MMSSFRDMSNGPKRRTTRRAILSNHPSSPTLLCITPTQNVTVTLEFSKRASRPVNLPRKPLFSPIFVRTSGAIPTTQGGNVLKCQATCATSPRLCLTCGDPNSSLIACMSILKAPPFPLPAATISGVLPVVSGLISISDIWAKRTGWCEVHSPVRQSSLFGLLVSQAYSII